MGHHMLKKVAVGATLLVTAIGSSAAFAAPATSGSESKFTPQFGTARPPIGFVRFCAEYPDECKAGLLRAKHIVMDPERWNLLYQVNTYVNGKIAPMSDLELYGEAERWAYPVDSGDCEDYLLLKKRYLEGLGFPAEALLITVVLDEKSDGHAILTVVTDTGDFILDNRRNDITRWKDTSYKFLKRQSQVNPRHWVALLKEKAIASGEVSASAQ
jgi:predicted transglutaminase-like cysteine proteinase